MDHKCLGCDGPADLYAAYCSVDCVIDDAADMVGCTLKPDFKAYLKGALLNCGGPNFDGIGIAYNLCNLFRLMR